MKSRRTFLKILAGLGAFLLPWTDLPGSLGLKLGNLLGRPPVKLNCSANSGTDDLKEDGFPEPPAEVLSRQVMTDIEALTKPEMEGRRAGTAGETRAIVYLEEQVRVLNLKPFAGKGYWQMFSIPSMQERIINGRALFRPDEADKLSVPAANILAGLPGRNQEEAVIISAHYDHLGIYNGQLYSGANDNASGVACVLRVMRRLVRDYCQGVRPRLNIIVVFWGAEEMGYLGSKYFVKNPLIPLSKLKAVINYDTVGNGEKKDYILWSNGESPLLAVLKRIAASKGASLEVVSGQGHHSDEISFLGTGVPAVTLLSRDWLDKNHTPEDNLSLLNEEKMETACNILYDTLKEIAY